MVQLDRAGLNYADNLVDYLLTFNESSTWTIASGTGTATRDLDNPFSGVASLKINNTAPTTNLTVTNSVQSSVIPFASTFQITCYVKKVEPLEELTGAMLIYKNAVLLATESFSVGSEVVEEDITNEWARFQTSNNYVLAKNDVITFQFRLDGIVGTPLTDTTIWIDGIMINDALRQDFAVPIYVPAVKSIDSTNVTAITANYTASYEDVVLADATTGAITVALPLAKINKRVNVKKVDASGNNVTIDGNGAQTIDGTLTKIITTQYDSITMISDGSNWFII